MIRNEAEYQEAVRRSDEERSRVADHAERLRTLGLSDDEVKRALEPLESFHLQLQEEIESYERLKRCDFAELHNFRGLGTMLIGLRIARGLTQRELAEKLDVTEQQVSRDERNEYRGVSVERASRILDALRADLRTKVELTLAANGSPEDGSDVATGG